MDEANVEDFDFPWENPQVKKKEPQAGRSSSKPRRSSILKVPKPLTAIENNGRQNQEYSVKRERSFMKRVSFSSSKQVKEFQSGSQTLTIWNNTYEEENSHTNNSNSSATTSEITAANTLANARPGLGPQNEEDESPDSFLDMLSKNRASEPEDLEKSMMVPGCEDDQETSLDMEMTVPVKCLKERKTQRAEAANETVAHGTDMEMTIAMKSSNEKQSMHLSVHGKEQDETAVDMEMTVAVTYKEKQSCSLQKSAEGKNDTALDMEMTMPVKAMNRKNGTATGPDLGLSLSTLVEESRNDASVNSFLDMLSNKKASESKDLEKSMLVAGCGDDQHESVDMQMTMPVKCLKGSKSQRVEASNETEEHGTDMEMTIAAKSSNEREAVHASEHEKEKNGAADDMEMTAAVPAKEKQPLGLPNYEDEEEDVVTAEMEMTAAVTAKGLSLTEEVEDKTEDMEMTGAVPSMRKQSFELQRREEKTMTAAFPARDKQPFGLKIRVKTDEKKAEETTDDMEMTAAIPSKGKQPERCVEKVEDTADDMEMTVAAPIKDKQRAPQSEECTEKLYHTADDMEMTAAVASIKKQSFGLQRSAEETDNAMEMTAAASARDKQPFGLKIRMKTDEKKAEETTHDMEMTAAAPSKDKLLECTENVEDTADDMEMTVAAPVKEKQTTAQSEGCTEKLDHTADDMEMTAAVASMKKQSIGLQRSAEETDNAMEMTAAVSARDKQPFSLKQRMKANENKAEETTNDMGMTAAAASKDKLLECTEKVEDTADDMEMTVAAPVKEKQTTAQSEECTEKLDHMADDMEMTASVSSMNKQSVGLQRSVKETAGDNEMTAAVSAKDRQAFGFKIREKTDEKKAEETTNDMGMTAAAASKDKLLECTEKVEDTADDMEMTVAAPVKEKQRAAQSEECTEKLDHTADDMEMTASVSSMNKQSVGLQRSVKETAGDNEMTAAVSAKDRQAFGFKIREKTDEEKAEETADDMEMTAAVPPKDKQPEGCAEKADQIGMFAALSAKPVETKPTDRTECIEEVNKETAQPTSNGLPQEQAHNTTVETNHSIPLAVNTTEDVPEVPGDVMELTTVSAAEDKQSKEPLSGAEPSSAFNSPLRKKPKFLSPDEEEDTQFVTKSVSKMFLKRIAEKSANNSSYSAPAAKLACLDTSEREELLEDEHESILLPSEISYLSRSSNRSLLQSQSFTHPHQQPQPQPITKELVLQRYPGPASQPNRDSRSQHLLGQLSSQMSSISGLLHRSEHGLEMCYKAYAELDKAQEAVSNAPLPTAVQPSKAPAPTPVFSYLAEKQGKGKPGQWQLQHFYASQASFSFWNQSLILTLSLGLKLPQEATPEQVMVKHWTVNSLELRSVSGQTKLAEVGHRMLLARLTPQKLLDMCPTTRSLASTLDHISAEVSLAMKFLSDMHTVDMSHSHLAVLDRNSLRICFHSVKSVFSFYVQIDLSRGLDGARQDKSCLRVQKDLGFCPSLSEVQSLARRSRPGWDFVPSFVALLDEWVRKQ